MRYGRKRANIHRSGHRGRKRVKVIGDDGKKVPVRFALQVIYWGKYLITFVLLMMKILKVDLEVLLFRCWGKIGLL